MRVTHVITRLIIGGAQENTIASVLGLREKFGVETNLISGPTTGPEGSLESTFHSHPGILTILPSLVRPVHPWKDLLAWQELTRLFRARAPDIVHTHSGKAGVLGRLAAQRAKVPCIVHTIHGPSFGPFQGPLPNFLFRAAERIAARSTTHFVSVADAMTQQYLAAGIGTPGQFTRIYSGFDLDPFLAAQDSPAERERWGLSPADMVVGKMARLAPLKGHEDLVAAAPLLIKQCPRMKFLLIGDGVLRNRLEARVRELGLAQHFIFTGLVPPNAVPGLLGIMDVLIHLSRREGLARALPQALAAARPVIATDCDGAREVCLNGQTGFLVRPGVVGELVQRLVELATNSKLRRQMGTRGQALVRERFSLERMLNDLYALYHRLLNRAS